MEFNDQQKELIEKYRDINTDHDWWDYTYSDFAERMVEKGIDPDDFAFSGFWSQGDGASFCGRINMAQFLKVHDLEAEYPAATFFALRDEVSAKLVRKGNYYSHANTVSLNLTDDILNEYDDDDVRCAVYEAMAQEYVHGESDLEEKVLEICHGYMNDLYRNLHEEYEYLSSDEAVWETIEANDLHKEEEAA